MITKLTPEQESLLPVIRDEWIAHGLSTEPANRKEAELGVCETYAAADLEPPKIFIWCDSPWTGAIAQAVTPLIIIKQLRGESLPFSTEPYYEIILKVWNQIATQLIPYSGSKIIDSIIEDNNDSTIENEIIKSNNDISSMHLWNSTIKKRLTEWWQTRVAGQHWAGLYSFYDAMQRFGVKGIEPLAGQMRIAKNAGWWWPSREFVVITERPRELHHDPQGRLHCETGPAISYPDGWSVWIWHGTRVDPWVIEGTATVQRILQEQNTEIRRCAVEARASRNGWIELIKEANWPQIGSTVADPGNPGQVLSLYRVEDVYEEPVNLLLMTNGTVERDGTRREFGETVPSWIIDPVGAAAWQIDLKTEDYLQTVRRT